MKIKILLSTSLTALALVSSLGTGVKADLPQSSMVAEPVARDGEGKLVVRPLPFPESKTVVNSKCNITIPDYINDIVTRASKVHNVDAKLILSVIAVESAFDVKAKSNKGAMGLAQLIPATAKRFGVEDAYDPVQNINGAAAYLKWLLNEFNGNLHYSIASYNAGEGATKKYGGIPPYPETISYVKKVIGYQACL